MAVIAVLIGVGVPAFRGMQNEANVAKAQGDVKTLRVALESYYKNNSAFPAEGSNWEQVLTVAVPQILEGVVYDKFGSTSTTVYNYKLSENGRYFVVWSAGLNGNSTITGITDAGTLTGTREDDIFVSNGSGTF